MADKKISQLTGATTPLAGSEVLPIVQGGSTVKVSVDNLTAGKAVSAASVSATGVINADTEFRLGNVEYGKVAIGDGGGGFVGGYNITYSGGGVKYQTTGVIAGIYNATAGNIQFFSGISAAGGTTAPEIMRVETGGLTLAAASNLTLNNGTANGVLYLNGSKVATSGSALVFDGTNLGIGAASGTSTGYTTAPRLFGYNDGAFTSLLASSGSSASCQFRTALYRDATGSSSISMAKFRGTYASPTVVQSGDQAGILQWDVFAGTNIRRIAAIRGTVDTYTSDTQVGGYLTFETNRNADSSSGEKMRLTSAGNLKIGGTADRATTEGDKQLVLFNGTAPVGTLSNGISIYSSSGEAYVMDAAGNATLFSPHDSETNEWIFKSKHTPTGKVLRIDVERLLRFVNDHFGLDAVKEFVEV